MAPIEMENAPDDSSTGAFSVLNQKVELDFTFCPRSVKGKTTIDIQPQTAQLREISLNCRQLKPSRVKVENRLTSFNYSNLYQRLTLYPGTGIQQHHWPKRRLQKHKDGVEDELVIFVPETVKISEVQPEDAGMDAPSKGNVFYAPLKVEIEYVLDDFRDAFHFVGVEDGDSRYPHAYTRNSPFPGMASCLFPCVDDGSTRCIYEISIRYPRTLGDALSKPPSRPGHATSHVQANGIPKADSVMSDADDDHTDLTEEEKAMEMVVICSGELTDDILDPEDPSRKTASFTCATPVLPQHIGFVIGPFEHVDLSDFRDTSDDDRLGDNAIKVHAFCLPGREDEVRNSAMMLARTLDNFTERYQSYAFEKAYKLAFVDDLDCDASHTASFSICSSRLLFPETVWEPLEHTTRVLVHAVASQWIGVDVIAQGPNDHWVIVGGSWFMTELYLRELFGRNDHRFRQKLMVDKIVQMDVRRPSLHSLGAYLPLDPGELEFMELKALLVLSILHNRLVKQSGKNGVDRCLYRLLFHARNGKLPNGAISTDSFLEICEKVGHQKLDTFFNQWIMSSGCPTFECSPTFNKKKQVVQLIIKQTQSDATLRSIENSFASKDFMREAKERIHGFSPATDWPAFVGPMTIRIHEADGTPYEHIVDINSSAVKVEIPYNTKYKRLKRNRLNKERMAAAHGIDAAGESQEDVTFYSLGDMFLSVEEAEEWKISEWSPEDETKMDNEAYEWIRVDADFEWICRANLVDMPSYMYVSQLQQDKDVVAQAESIQYLALKEGHPLISSILVKTLMDHRYFHGIRTMAAEVMAQSAKKQISWIGLFHLKKAFRELFCLPGQPMTRSNDFSDRASYLIQCAIPKAIARIKDIDGKAPMEAKRFLLDIMRYNDNRGNAYSDDHYIATLMRSLAESLTSSKTGSMDITLNLEDEAEEFDFTKKALEELSRHQRLDEWIPTYQNIYTITALDCLFQLSTNRVIPFKPSEFMQYAQIGNADNVRIKAWDCLIRLGMARRDSVLKFLIHEIQSDPSPYVRGQLLRIFDTAVGQIATGDVFAIDSAKKTQADSLVIEHSAGTSEREASLARQKLDGALAGLKADLANHHALRLALEDALMSTTLSARDMSELLDFSSMVFDTDDSLQIRLRYPRYWRVERVGRTQLRFYESDRVRTQPLRPLKPAEPVPQPAPIERSVAPPAPKVKLQLKTAKPPKVVASPTQQPESAMSLERRQSNVLSPPAERATSPATIAVKLPPKAPSLPPVIKKESPAAPPKSSPPAAILPPKKTPTPTPTPAIQSPVPAPSVAPARASAPPVPAAIPIPTSVSTPPAIHSPIPAPAPKLKIKTGISKSSTSTPKAAGTPVSKPPATKPATPKPASSKPPVAKSSVPKQPKPKKSKIVKLKLPPTVLSQFPKESGKKRKLESEDTERPSKRQSLDPNGLLNGGKSRVSLERHGGEKPRLLLKLNVGRDNLPPS